MLIKYSTMKRCISLILATVLLISVFPMQAKATESVKSDRIIVSLGDSYASGEGIEPFYGQDEPLSEKVKNEDWLAHRSENAWSGMLTIPGVTGTMAENFDTHWFFAASSGAETKHIFSCEQKKSYYKTYLTTQYVNGRRRTVNAWYRDSKDLDKQIDIFDQLAKEGKKADYVTISIGGNDADFAGIITKIVLGTAFLDISGLSNKIYDTWGDFYKEGGIRDQLKATYNIIAEKAGPQAAIIVVGYPRLLNPNGNGSVITQQEAEIVNRAVTLFNLAISDVVTECREQDNLNIHFVSVEDAFGDNGAYTDESTALIHKVIFGAKDEDIDDSSITSAYSMHPNYKGACVYAKCVQEKIDALEQERMFDETCWMWSKGVTAGSAYAVLFHLDGTLSYYKMNEDLLGSTSYEYKNGTLTIDGIDYTWQDDQFVSVEKFEVNGSAEPESFNLYTDDQKRFYQFVPSFSTEHFTDEIQAKFGMASYTEFVSCVGTWFQEYPASIDGFITAVSVDVNADGKDEQLALISKNQSISLQVYSEINGKYMLFCEKDIASIDYCAQQNISLFYNEELNGYLLFVDKSTAGAYTGNDAKYATIYEVDCTQINLVCQASADYFGIASDDIDGHLVALNVPYAQNCAEINNITSQSQYIELLEIRHKYFNADPMGGWAGREHHLQLLTPETRNKPIESPQTWTITKRNSGFFSPYQEVTYSVELEAGQVYTIYPEWPDGTKSGGIIVYEVDTQERTITIMMDSPEGCEHWKSLVIDLIDNTYYGQGYTEY